MLIIASKHAESGPGLDSSSSNQDAKPIFPLFLSKENDFGSRESRRKRNPFYIPMKAEFLKFALETTFFFFFLAERKNSFKCRIDISWLCWTMNTSWMQLLLLEYCVSKLEDTREPAQLIKDKQGTGASKERGTANRQFASRLLGGRGARSQILLLEGK